MRENLSEVGGMVGNGGKMDLLGLRMQSKVKRSSGKGRLEMRGDLMVGNFVLEVFKNGFH